MFDQDNIMYLISLSILTTCLCDNVLIFCREKSHVNHVWEFKGFKG